MFSSQHWFTVRVLLHSLFFVCLRTPREIAKRYQTQSYPVHLWVKPAWGANRKQINVLWNNKSGAERKSSDSKLGFPDKSSMKIYDARGTRPRVLARLTTAENFVWRLYMYNISSPKTPCPRFLLKNSVSDVYIFPFCFPTVHARDLK